MKCKSSVLAVIAAMMCVTPSLAQNIKGPTQIVSVTSTIPNGDPTYPLSAIADTVIGNGNIAPYNGFVGPENVTGVISFTLDKAYDLDAAHLWNDINVRAEGVGRYSWRFYDASNNPIGGPVGPFSTTPEQMPAHVTPLSVGGVKRVELVVDSIQAVPNTFVRRVEIREVQFNGKPTMPMAGDHYGCYRVRDAQALRPETLQIRDQFGRAEVVLGRPVMVCNPSIKVHNDRTFGVRNPERHMVCYDIARQSDQQRPRRVSINNQMAPAELTTDVRQMYCVPSSKKLVGEPEMPVEASRE